jgi:hypothetical protein
MQERSPEKAWRIWKKWLSNFLYATSNQLNRPMLPWLPNNKPNRIWYHPQYWTVLNNLTPIAPLKRDYNSNQVIQDQNNTLALTVIIVICNSRLVNNATQIILENNKISKINMSSKKLRHTKAQREATYWPLMLH